MENNLILHYTLFELCAQDQLRRSIKKIIIYLCTCLDSYHSNELQPKIDSFAVLQKLCKLNLSNENASLQVKIPKNWLRDMPYIKEKFMDHTSLFFTFSNEFWLGRQGWIDNTSRMQTRSLHISRGFIWTRTSIDCAKIIFSGWMIKK